MSEETIKGIEAAVRAHIADVYDEPDPVVGDWFLAYACMRHDPDSDNGISYTSGYTTPDTTPHGALGIARIGVRLLENDLCGNGEEDL